MKRKVEKLFSLSSLFYLWNLCVFWPESSSYHSQNANRILNSSSMFVRRKSWTSLHRLKVKKFLWKLIRKSWVFIVVDDEVHDTNLCNCFRLSWLLFNVNATVDVEHEGPWSPQDTLWHNTVSLLSCFSFSPCFAFLFSQRKIINYFILHFAFNSFLTSRPLVKQASDSIRMQSTGT